MREFECSGIHDLFKVVFCSSLCVFFFFLIFFLYVELPFVHEQAMSKFYTATCQAKELTAKAKTAKDKAKELKNEILLKKGEVLRLTEDFNRLQGSETKLKTRWKNLKLTI